MAGSRLQFVDFHIQRARRIGWLCGTRRPSQRRIAPTGTGHLASPSNKFVVKGTQRYEILFAAPRSDAETDQVYPTVRFLLSQRKRPASRRSTVRGA